MYTLLHQRHVHRMDDGLSPHLCFVDSCKRDMKSCNIDTNNRESQARDRQMWKSVVSRGLSIGEKNLWQQNQTELLRKKISQHTELCKHNDAQVSTCKGFIRQFKSRIGIYSHNHHLDKSIVYTLINAIAISTSLIYQRQISLTNECYDRIYRQSNEFFLRVLLTKVSVKPKKMSWI